MTRFKERLKALYVRRRQALWARLEILLDSESLFRVFTRQELVEVMAQRDQSMLDQLDAYMEETQRPGGAGGRPAGGGRL